MKAKRVEKDIAKIEHRTNQISKNCKAIKSANYKLKNIGVFDDEEIEFKECPAKTKPNSYPHGEKWNGEKHGFACLWQVCLNNQEVVFPNSNLRNS